MGIEEITITKDECAIIVSFLDQEGQFVELKSVEIAPSSLTETIAAFANSDGGELYIGVTRDWHGEPLWKGFRNQEQANSHLAVFEQLFPLGQDFKYTFLSCHEATGLVLKAEISKTREIKFASDSMPYIRRGAQNLPVDTEDKLAQLRRSKGITSFETETVAADVAVVTN